MTNLPCAEEILMHNDYDVPGEGFVMLDMVDQLIEYEQGQLSATEEETLFQHLVDTGMAWQLQGHYGRTAQRMLGDGRIKSPFTVVADSRSDEDIQRIADAYSPPDEDV